MRWYRQLPGTACSCWTEEDFVCGKARRVRQSRNLALLSGRGAIRRIAVCGVSQYHIAGNRPCATSSMYPVSVGSVFIRHVLQRDAEKHIDVLHLEAFPVGHWFWCYPQSDSSSSIKALCLKSFQYTAQTDFQVCSIEAFIESAPPTLKPQLQAFAHMNNPCIEQQVLSFVNAIIHTSGSDVIGLKRNTGSGDEYIFFSKTSSAVLTAEELQT